MLDALYITDLIPENDSDESQQEAGIAIANAIELYTFETLTVEEENLFHSMADCFANVQNYHDLESCLHDFYSLCETYGVIAH